MEKIINKKELPVIEHFSDTDSNIKIFSLGGLEEIGKNMYCIECQNELIIIDAGIMFPDSEYGIEYSIPNFQYLKENQAKIKGLFITHGHEDHIGAIGYLLKSVNVPKIYASGIAIDLIKMKLADFDNNMAYELEEITSESVYTFKNFEVSFFRTIHSIPDSLGIAVKTRLGYILHSGDFKIDFTPLGKPMEYDKLIKYQKEGVLCLLSDSTNACVKAFSKSEKEIGESIDSIFSTIKGRIIISTFASNVHRVSQIIQASAKYNRKIVVLGRSMRKIVACALSRKYIDIDEHMIITEKELANVSNKNLTILSTGSQGEPAAALSRIANGENKNIHIEPDDTVIFSSSAIPGNQQSINATINKLYQQGANVIVNSPLSDTHTTGHASEMEEAALLSWTQPKHFMPIHGEETMLYRHAETAHTLGIPYENIHIMSNGEVLTFSGNKCFINCQVPNGDVNLDLNGSILEDYLVAERKLLSEEGIIMVVFLKNKQNRLLDNPKVFAKGFLYFKNNEGIFEGIGRLAREVHEEYVTNNSVFILPNFRRMLVERLSQYLANTVDRHPLIVINTLVI